MTAAEKKEYEFLMARATGKDCCLNMKQLDRLRELINKKETDK